MQVKKLRLDCIPNQNGTSVTVTGTVHRTNRWRTADRPVPAGEGPGRLCPGQVRSMIHSTTPLRGCPVACLDFETTGPDPDHCQPVSVAVHRLLLGETEPEQVFSSLIRPNGPIPAESTEIHGITDAMVEGAPSAVDVVDMLKPLLGDCLMAAYNLPFDWQVLKRYHPILPWGGLDPLVWVRCLHRYDKGEGRHKLTTIAPKYGVDLGEDAHEASADAKATALLMPLLLRKLVRHRDGPRGTLDRGALSVADLWAWQLHNAMADELRFATYVLENKPLDRAPMDLRWRELTREHWADVAPKEQTDADA